MKFITPSLVQNPFTGTLASFFIPLMILLMMNSCRITAQEFDELETSDEYTIKLYYSEGAGERAAKMAERCDKAIDYYRDKLNYEPQVSLLVLDREDWQKYAGNPVYGMPHYTNSKLIVAAEDNPFWRSFIPPAEQLPAGLKDRILATYTDDEGRLSMQSFFDLLALHELGHAYHLQNDINMQRRWLSEFFANLFLRAYIEAEEPGKRDVLTLFPRMVVSNTDTANLTYTSLKDFEDHYDELGQKYPQNYGWYQSRLTLMAWDVYESGGVESLVKIFESLKKHDESLNDDELAQMLSESLSPTAGEVLLNWE